MVIAIDPTATRPYVLTSDRDLPAEQRTTFYVRSLPARTMARVMAIEGTGTKRDAEWSLAVVAEGVARWENLKYPNGQDVPDKAGLADVLPSDAITELAAEILRGSRLTDADRKNSASPPASS